MPGWARPLLGAMPSLTRARRSPSPGRLLCSWPVRRHAAAIARENNDPLAQGRMLSPQEGGEGGAVQAGHRQVTHHHVVGALLELCQDVLAKAV